MRADCPGRPVLDTVTSRWGVPILTALAERPHRFAELRDRMAGVSEKMLAQTLRGLAGNGFVLRTEAPTVPPQVTYSLTTRGQELRDVLDRLGPTGYGEMAEVPAGGCAPAGRAKGALDAPGARGGEQGGRAAPGGVTDLDQKRPGAGDHRGLHRDGGGQAEARPTDGAGGQDHGNQR